MRFGQAVWPPLIWPMMSASASSTVSLSIMLLPGIEGPPVWMVLWMPYLRAQATIFSRLVAGLHRAEADFAEQGDAGGGEFGEIVLLHAEFQHRRPGQHLHPAPGGR